MKYVIPKFQYETKRISQLRAFKEKEMGETFIEIDGVKFRTTRRFWDSLCSRFGFGPSIFNYFDHEEVFDRISERKKVVTTDKTGKINTEYNDRLRVCMMVTPPQELKPMYAKQKKEGRGEFIPELLGVSNPDKIMVDGGRLMEIYNQHTPTIIGYANGAMTTVHEPRRPVDFDIGGDSFKTAIYLEMPVDGYGKPTLYLGLVRASTKSVLVAYGKAFETGIILGRGDVAVYTVNRILSSFSNEDGFVVVKDRLKTAQGSWASVWECFQLGKILGGFRNDSFQDSYAQRVANQQLGDGMEFLAESLPTSMLRNEMIKKLYQVSGDLREIYGVAQIDAIDIKRMRMLGTKCTVYDLLTFATEAATYQLKPESALMLQSFCGRIISESFDLEDSCKEFKTFESFFFEKSKPDMLDVALLIENDIGERQLELETNDDLVEIFPKSDTTAL